MSDQLSNKVGPGSLVVLRSGKSLEATVYAHLSEFRRRFGAAKVPVLVLVPEGAAAPAYVLGNVPVQRSRYLMSPSLVYLVAAVNATRSRESLKFSNRVPKSS